MEYYYIQTLGRIEGHDAVLVEVESTTGACDLATVEVCLCEVADLLKYSEEWLEKATVADIHEAIDLVWEDLAIECSDLLPVATALPELKICPAA